MKKLFAITVLFVGFAISSYAQEAPSTKEETRKEAKKKLKHELNLTREQAKELKGANQDFKDKAHAIKDDDNLTKEQKREKMQSLQKEKNDKFKTILTPEQQQKMSQMKKEGHKRKSHRKPAETK